MKNQIRTITLFVTVLVLLLSACSPAAPTSAPVPVATGGGPAAPQHEANPSAQKAAERPPATYAPQPTQAPRQPGSISPAPTMRPPQEQAYKPVAPLPTASGCVFPCVQPPAVEPPSNFQDYGVNPFIDSSRDHLSTFGLDVDTASYTVARDYIRQGNLPPYEGVRVEEFVNYFKQDYPDPKDATFAVYADGAPSPFHSDGSYLLRVGIQGRHIYDEERKPAHLTFVIDTSGSMNQDGRLEMVKQSLDLMISRLQPNDMVAIVAYNENAWTVLNSTPLTNRQAIRNALYNLRPGGSTNVSAGLQLGYQHAMNMLDGQANNRVILCSDGVANTGDTSIEGILESVNGYVQRGVTLTTVGVGMGNYNDVLLEQLADKGNGQYTYVDTLEQANKFFGEDLTGTLQTIAFDAKVQVDFNPDVVAQYRLLGYENRAIADQNFRNDSVDAGEVGAGHSATAVYAIQLRPGSQGRLATIQLRWKDVESRSVVETNGNFNTWDLTKDFQSASPRYQLTIAAAQFAEILRQSPYANRGTLQDLQRYTSTIARQLPYDQEVVEFDQIVARAAQIGW